MCILLLYSFITTSMSTALNPGTRIIFWQSAQPEVRNSYPYLRIFLTQKTADLIDRCLFFFFFRNQVSQFETNTADFTFFFRFFFFFFFFCEMGPSSKDFFDQNGTLVRLRIFGEKVTHLGGTSPYVLTCENPPGGSEPLQLKLQYLLSLFTKWIRIGLCNVKVTRSL